ARAAARATSSGFQSELVAAATRVVGALAATSASGRAVAGPFAAAAAGSLRSAWGAAWARRCPCRVARGCSGRGAVAVATVCGTFAAGVAAGDGAFGPADAVVGRPVRAAPPGPASADAVPGAAPEPGVARSGDAAGAVSADRELA